MTPATAATVVNLASWFASVDILTSPFVACIVLIALGVLALWLLVTRNVRELVFAVIWAVIAIGVNQLESSFVVGAVAFAVGAACLIAVLVHAYKNRHDNEINALVKSFWR